MAVAWALSARSLFHVVGCVGCGCVGWNHCHSVDARPVPSRRQRLESTPLVGVVLWNHIQECHLHRHCHCCKVVSVDAFATVCSNHLRCLIFRHRLESTALVAPTVAPLVLQRVLAPDCGNVVSVDDSPRWNHLRCLIFRQRLAQGSTPLQIRQRQRLDACLLKRNNHMSPPPPPPLLQPRQCLRIYYDNNCLSRQKLCQWLEHFLCCRQLRQRLEHLSRQHFCCLA